MTQPPTSARILAFGRMNATNAESRLGNPEGKRRKLAGWAMHELIFPIENEKNPLLC